MLYNPLIFKYIFLGDKKYYECKRCGKILKYDQAHTLSYSSPDSIRPKYIAVFCDKCIAKFDEWLKGKDDE